MREGLNDGASGGIVACAPYSGSFSPPDVADVTPLLLVTCDSVEGIGMPLIC